ncbi:hypothetical protein V5O48_000428 [Marasmius crinis-equi]|uniref:TECPR1-like DysF domain-containing protein n=1 Tax=Marasmius crinis-equi TaxID=585013 RepID=A0ABR3G195_9AGAR
MTSHSSNSRSPTPVPAPPLPPPPTADNDPSTSESARKHLEPPSRFPLSFSTPNLKHSVSKSKFKLKRAATKPAATADDEDPNLRTSSEPVPDIALNDQPLHAEGHDDDKDRYEWAVFNSLLPSDPPPFTVPSIAQKRSHQPVVSLKDYPLPDGNWRWVSKSWMIDMRTDSGEVQHDGFEYNWVFRKHQWRAQVGSLSTGGYVRRRRWVRLMMRPGSKTREGEAHGGEGVESVMSTPTVASASTSWMEKRLRRRSLPASVFASSSVASTSVEDEREELWQGNVDEDWKMCRYLLREAGRDGAKLELWKRWLGLELDEPTGEEVTPPLPAPPLQYVKDILRVHASEIMQSFVFPDSRARFIKYLEQADIYTELQQALESEPNWSIASDAGLAFWSLNSEIDITQADGSGRKDKGKASS